MLVREKKTDTPAEMDDLRRMVEAAQAGGEQELYFFFHISPTMTGAQVATAPESSGDVAINLAR